MTTAQDQQSRELLPCPFCGREAMMSHSRDGEVCNVRCAGWSVGNCLGAGPNCYTEADAVAGWSRRAPAEQAARALPATGVEPMGRVPPGWQVTEEMHIAAVKVLHRASGVDGLPQRMVDAMLAAAPRPPAAQERKPLIARQLGEWHEDDGPVSWWAWCGREWAGEPAWVGTPNSSDWPGYHTHWTPHPEFPAEPGTKASS